LRRNYAATRERDAVEVVKNAEVGRGNSAVSGETVWDGGRYRLLTRHKLSHGSGERKRQLLEAH